MSDNNASTGSVTITLPVDVCQRLKFLRKFKHRLPGLNDDIEKLIFDMVTESESKVGITGRTWKSSKPCPKCMHGVLYPKKSKRRSGAASFFGCSRFPKCRHSEKI